MVRVPVAVETLRGTLPPVEAKSVFSDVDPFEPLELASAISRRSSRRHRHFCISRHVRHVSYDCIREEVSILSSLVRRSCVASPALRAAFCFPPGRGIRTLVPSRHRARHPDTAHLRVTSFAAPAPRKPRQPPRPVSSSCACPGRGLPRGRGRAGVVNRAGPIPPRDGDRAPPRRPRQAPGRRPRVRSHGCAASRSCVRSSPRTRIVLSISPSCTTPFFSPRVCARV